MIPMQTYKVVRLREIDLNHWKIVRYVYDCLGKVNDIYGNKFRDPMSFPIVSHFKYHYTAICYRDKEPVGMIMGVLSNNYFDKNVRMLRQLTLFAEPGTRAANYLMKDFIDFGKHNANHIISTINTKTNIKGRSLEKLGFKKTEQVFKMEVSNE